MKPGVRYAALADLAGIAGEDIEPGDVLGVSADGLLCVADREIDRALASSVVIPHRPHAMNVDLRRRCAYVLSRAFVEGIAPPRAPFAPLLSFGYFRRSRWRKLLDKLRSW